MSQMNQPNPYAMYDEPMFASDAPVNERAEFLKKTYLHLMGAVGVFVALEFIWFQVLPVESIIATMISGYNWLIVLGAFLLVSYMSERMAQNAVDIKKQYLGLGIYILAESLIFLPMIYLALLMTEKTGTNIIGVSAISTIGIFAALSGIVYSTRKDFSFLRGALYMLGIIAMGVIVCSIIFGFSLGTLFTVLMIGFASLWILYSTSNVLHHYQTSQYVVASLALFAALALLFWYVLRLAMILAAEE